MALLHDLTVTCPWCNEDVELQITSTWAPKESERDSAIVYLTPSVASHRCKPV